MIADLWDVIPSKVSLTSNFTRLENNVAGVDRRNWWNGGDVNVHARLRGGVTVRGGVTAWTAGDDWCTYIENGFYGTGIPEGPGMRNCYTVSPVQAEYKALGNYVIPRIEVQVAATLTSRPGPPKSANLAVRADVIDDTLGRFPSICGVCRLDDDDQSVRNERGVLSADQRGRPAPGQDRALRTHARERRRRRLQPAQCQHRTDVQQHL